MINGKIPWKISWDILMGYFYGIFLWDIFMGSPWG